MREAIASDFAALAEKEGNKGRFGQVLEREYFGLENNSESRADFEEAGLELKAFPLKLKKRGGEMVSKERLVLNIIDYMSIGGESWLSSTFLKKNAHILLIGYLYNKGETYLEHIIKIISELDIPQLPPEDLKIIRDDWKTIVDKVRAGKAHELSESDTLYLGACTKGSTAESSFRTQPNGPAAKQRAFSFKQKFLNALILKDFDEAGRIVKSIEEYAGTDQSFEEKVISRFVPYYGKSFEEIAQLVGWAGNPKAKSRFADVTRAILGVTTKRIAEFELADIEAKTVRLGREGGLKESISFPAFRSIDLVAQKWEESDLREMLSHRFFFVVYQRGVDDKFHLKAARFWGMPESVLDTEVREVWEKTIVELKKPGIPALPKMSETRVVHVRPHGRLGIDRDVTPGGANITKQCFWLNAPYIAGELRE